MIPSIAAVQVRTIAPGRCTSQIRYSPIPSPRGSLSTASKLGVGSPPNPSLLLNHPGPPGRFERRSYEENWTTPSPGAGARASPWKSDIWLIRVPVVIGPWGDTHEERARIQHHGVIMREPPHRAVSVREISSISG